MLDENEKGEVKSVQKYRALKRKFKFKRTCLKVTIEELKRYLVSNKTKMERYGHGMKGYQNKRFFRVVRMGLQEKINGEYTDELLIPNNKKSQRIWGNIYSKDKGYKKNIE